jgi:hypothetical protein
MLSSRNTLDQARHHSSTIDKGKGKEGNLRKRNEIVNIHLNIMISLNLIVYGLALRRGHLREKIKMLQI